jgi:Leucine-rich repeat (LRR) protein
MPLRSLDACGVRGITDLEPLRGLPLHYLNLTETRAADLAPLAGLGDLRMLVLDAMPVSDLTPLRGLGLKELSIRGTQVTELSLIKELPLRRLRLDYRPDREAFLRSLTGLEFINDKPTADFWKEVAGK